MARRAVSARPSRSDGAAWGRAAGRDRGSVTVELALALPAVALLLALVLAAGSATLAQMACADTARAAARAAALGQDSAAVQALVVKRLGPAAGAVISVEGGSVKVTVSRPRPAGVTQWIGQGAVTATAVAACEPIRGCGP